MVLKYYGALERSQTRKQENIFLIWFFKRYLKECRIYRNEIEETNERR
jgi:hypothetical protein